MLAVPRGLPMSGLAASHACGGASAAPVLTRPSDAAGAGWLAAWQELLCTAAQRRMNAVSRRCERQGCREAPQGSHMKQRPAFLFLAFLFLA